MKALAVAVSATIIVTGCAGNFRQSFYSPRAPQGIAGASDRGDHLRIDLNGAELRIYRVFLSEQMWGMAGVPGILLPTPGMEPTKTKDSLRIELHVVNRTGSVSYDSRQFSLSVNDSAHAPLYVALGTPMPGTENLYMRLIDGRQEVDSGSFHHVWLTFGIPVSTLPRFSLRLGRIERDGRTIDIPPIPFHTTKRDVVK